MQPRKKLGLLFATLFELPFQNFEPLLTVSITDLQGMMGKRERLPTIMLVWTVLIVVTVSLVWNAFFG
jgi:hypothetical protein